MSVIQIDDHDMSMQLYMPVYMLVVTRVRHEIVGAVRSAIAGALHVRAVLEVVGKVLERDVAAAHSGPG